MIPSGYVGDSSDAPYLAPVGYADLGMPANWPMLSPADVLGQPLGSTGQPVDRYGGCCGPSGFDFLNIGCVEGHPVGIEQSECYLPHVSVLDPERVLRVVGEALGPTVVFLAQHQAHRTFADFCAELHAVFGFEEWYGEDLALILGKWGCRSPQRVDLVWRHSDFSRRCGLPMAAIEAAFAEQAMFVRLFLA